MKSIHMSNKMRFVGKGVKFERTVVLRATLSAPLTVSTTRNAPKSMTA